MKCYALAIVILQLASLNCAPVVAPASSAPAFEQPTGPIVLDEQGVRELLAGVELELGDERAAAAGNLARAIAAEKFLKDVQRQAEGLRQRAFWGPIVSGVIGAILGGVVGALGVYIGTR